MCKFKFKRIHFLFVYQVKTVKDRDRLAVLNKWNSHPQVGITAATKTPVELEPQKEVPPELPQVQPASHRFLPPGNSHLFGYIYGFHHNI